MSIEHHCGIVVAHTLNDAYSMLKYNQHRGRDLAGFGFIGEDGIDCIKYIGTVNRVDLHDLQKQFPSENYHTILGHVKYTTKGKLDLNTAHPITIGGTKYEYNNHIIIKNATSAIVHNGHVIDKYFKDLEDIVFETDCDTEKLLHYFARYGEKGLLEKIPGAYTVAIADIKRKDIIVMSDKNSIRPGVLGQKDGKSCFSSEDIAFRKTKGQSIEDIKPGNVYYLSPKGKLRKEIVLNKTNPKYCFFEWNYMQDRDSIPRGVYVKNLREKLGETLANEFNPADAKIVTFLPRSPEDAARSYAYKTNKELIYLFYKLRGERSFIGQDKNSRKDSINNNLYPNIENINLVKNESLIIIDDSTIRGNNINRVLDILEEFNVKKVYHLNYTPMVGVIGDDLIPRGCEFGVDMPPEDDFICRENNLNLDEKKISEKLSRNNLEVIIKFITKEGLFNVFENLGLSKKNLCSYCIGGENPLLPL